MAVTLKTEDLQWQRALLLETAKHAVGGCDERVWSAAATAAVALVLTLEGQSISDECLTSFCQLTELYIHLLCRMQPRVID